MAISSADPRLLCVAPSWLGDAVMARAAVARLGLAGCSVDLWARGALGRLFEDLPGVGAVLPMPVARTARFRRAWRLRCPPYDAVLVLPPSWSAACAAACTGARVRVGFAALASRGFLTHAVPSPGRTVHLATQYEALATATLGALGTAVPTAAAAVLALVERGPERDAAVAVRQARGIGGSYAVLAPGARYGPAKRWPAESFARAAALLRDQCGYTIVLAGDGSDVAATRAVQRLDPGSIDLAGTTSLAAFLGLLAGAAGVIANDSGTMHVAAALGRPVVGVFGSTDPRWTAPHGRRAAWVAEPPWCAPCFAPTCREDFACMLRITPERVVELLLTTASLPGTAAS